jgi:hypothetical protein
MVIFGCASHDDLHGLYRVKTEAPVSTPIHAKPAWLGAPVPANPRFRSLHFLGKKTPWQLLVQDIVWIADWAGCQGAGERIRRRRDLFHFFLGE